jgi:hypothetical protein
MKDKAINWHRHIQQQAKSSQTVQRYCDRHRLSPGMFYYWKRKLSTTVLPALSFQEVEVSSPVHLFPVIEIHFGSGKLIRIEGQVSPAFLRELIQC